MSATSATVEPNSGSRRAPLTSTPSRTQSTRTRSIPTHSTPVRANSSHSRPSSSRPVEDVLPQRDYETSNVAQASRRRSSDRAPPSRSESSRAVAHQRTSSRSTRHYHQPADMPSTSAASNGAGPAPAVVPAGSSHVSSGARVSRPRAIECESGSYILGKTIGAGSMGKVKLATHEETGDKFATKIVPRGSTNEDNPNQSKADRERADHSKEVRTAREAAIVTLLNHPYICGMRDFRRTEHHWYMIFEYVNGGQMLDYIISHGRLKEKQARKFSRQIASALDYCHRNSIVHRDLKIENILISKSGDIKIIDFGLSNLFRPRGHLKTFCGSLYFAAPELLQAKQYTGPEVDVWSFGIVLYVLVCGKVPFDDQSMPALHAKIKKGIVDYPNWLSAECKNLISRMLVTDPSHRASLHEIMNHPWMVKGFPGPPDNYLPQREPLQLPLDPYVVQKMTGFNFGSPEYITEELTKILASDDYQRAVKLAARERELQQPRDGERKRGGFSFDFRRRSMTSRDTLNTPSVEGLQLGTDPVNAFDPLVSVYYLAREKEERDRKAANPGATSMPRSPGEASLQLPEVPALPKAAYTNAATYEMPGERATGGRSRPRARTHGEDEVTDGMRHVKIAGSSGPPSPAMMEPPGEPHSKKEGGAASLLRRFSTRRRKDSDKPIKDNKYYPPMVTVKSPDEGPSTLKKSSSTRRTQERARDIEPSPVPRSGSRQPRDPDLLTPPQSADRTRGSRGLGRSTSVNSADFRKRTEERAASNSPRVTYDAPSRSQGSDNSIRDEQKVLNQEAGDPEQKSNLAPRTATTRAKSLGHARKDSIQARRVQRQAQTENVPEETDEETGDNNVEKVDSTENMKPVFLKGIFSVSTTSGKSVSIIRAEIIRVLRQLGVEYTEIRGGFSCRHVPSIDLNRVADLPPTSPPVQTPGHRRRISFGGFNKGGVSERDRDDFRESERGPHTPRTPRRTHPDASFTNSDLSEDDINTGSRRAAGETTTHVQSDLGGSMVLVFEIFLVKVPLLSLHGIQFKKVAGGTWQYKNMADQILKELRL